MPVSRASDPPSLDQQQQSAEGYLDAARYLPANVLLMLASLEMLWCRLLGPIFVCAAQMSLPLVAMPDSTSERGEGGVGGAMAVFGRRNCNLPLSGVSDA